MILFGLSMDYHVFILSRIREAFDRGMTTEDAVAHGIKTTAGVVTSAALVMFGVFSIFATLQFMFLKQFGVGLAIAVLVDATIVRAVLLPATMKLLGDWNWYLPRWLEWLPQPRSRISRAGGTRGAGRPADGGSCTGRRLAPSLYSRSPRSPGGCVRCRSAQRTSSKGWTAREVEVLALVAERLTDAEVAERSS